MEAIQTMAPADCSESMSARVVEALAVVKNRDPTSLSPPLYEAVDPDALNSLLAADNEIEVRFDYDGHDVVASSDGTVTVDGRRY